MRSSRPSDQDPEIQAHGKYFTCSYLLDMGTHTFVVEMTTGKVHAITVDPGPLDRPYQFAIRGQCQDLAGVRRPVPAPMYHGIWAASFQRDMKLEGDVAGSHAELAVRDNARSNCSALSVCRSDSPAPPKPVQNLPPTKEPSR